MLSQKSVRTFVSILYLTTPFCICTTEIQLTKQLHVRKFVEINESRLITAPEECCPQMKKFRTKHTAETTPGYNVAV